MTAKTLSPDNIAGTAPINPRRTPQQRAVAQTVKLLYRLGQPMSHAEIEAAYGFVRGEDSINNAHRNRRSATGPQLRTLISADLCRAIGVYPVDLKDGQLNLHATKPLNEQIKAKIREAVQTAGFELTAISQTPADNTTVRKLLNNFDSISSEAVAELIADMNRTVSAGGEPLGSTITTAIDGIITEALQMRASDIHIDYDYTNPLFCWIRLRIDGDVYAQHNMAPAVMRPIVAALKTRADIDASNVELPQDGRMSFPWNGRSVDIRVATTRHDSGEKMVMRLLDPAALLSLSVLFSHTPAVLERLKAYTSRLSKGQGILILSGPTGSGKSTTFYALLMAVDRLTRGVITAENPVEAKIPFVTQCPVRDSAGRRFADLVRAFLRQDPDYIGIGETRDTETAEALARAAETGHHCLTTVHAYSVSQSIERICGMFTPAYREIGRSIIAHALAGVVNQSLVKCVCPNCRGHIATEEALASLQPHARTRLVQLGNLPPVLPIARQVDCKVCQATGFRGRVLVAESLFLPPNTDDRAKIANLVAAGQHHEILRMDSVTYIDRAEAAAPLLKAGMIDVQTFNKAVSQEHMA